MAHRGCATRRHYCPQRWVCRADSVPAQCAVRRVCISTALLPQAGLSVSFVTLDRLTEGTARCGSPLTPPANHPAQPQASRCVGSLRFHMENFMLNPVLDTVAAPAMGAPLLVYPPCISEAAPSNPTAGTPYRLDAAALTLAVGFAMQDQPLGTEGDTQLARIQASLWREDPETVAEVYHRLRHKGWGEREGAPRDPNAPLARDLRTAARHALVERLTEGWTHPATRKAKPRQRSQRHGLGVSDLAARAGVPREAMARALEHHGYLELVPYGGSQKRRLVTEPAETAGYGRNVNPAFSRSAKLDGANRASPFAVFYPDRVPELLARLDFAGIAEKVAALPDRRGKLAFLLEHHAYLPDDFIAGLTGYSRPGVRRARDRQAEK